MLIKIDKPNSQLDWIVIETDAIISITPSDNIPAYCLVRLSNDRTFHMQKELVNKIIPHVPVLNEV